MKVMCDTCIKGITEECLNAYALFMIKGSGCPDFAPLATTALFKTESDPTGRQPGDPGAKCDAGKPRISLIINGFPRALWAIAEVATFGAGKYSDGGWQSVPNGQERYFDAGLRHMLKKAMGEERDIDSGLLHLQQEAWNSLAKLELYLREVKAKL